MINDKMVVIRSQNTDHKMEIHLPEVRAAFDQLKERFHSVARVGDAIAGLSKDWFVKQDCVWCSLWFVELCLWCRFDRVDDFSIPVGITQNREAIVKASADLLKTVDYKVLQSLETHTWFPDLEGRTHIGVTVYVAVRCDMSVARVAWMTAVVLTAPDK